MQHYRLQQGEDSRKNKSKNECKNRARMHDIALLEKSKTSKIQTWIRRIKLFKISNRLQIGSTSFKEGKWFSVPTQKQDQRIETFQRVKTQNTAYDTGAQIRHLLISEIYGSSSGVEADTPSRMGLSWITKPLSSCSPWLGSSGFSMSSNASVVSTTFQKKNQTFSVI